jgi:prepilin-type N-terminal cleavage/methylation domain-containing protein/prepilin-type processing-associated H-X9-DG protein
MTYIHELESVLSSIFLLRSSFWLSLPGLANIMGLQASRSMAKNTLFARGFTLIELIVVLAVIAILMSMVYPMYTSISERAKATKDLSNLRQFGLALQTYLNDKDGVLPAVNAAPGIGTDLIPVIYPNYIGKTRKVLQSPFDKRPASETDSAPVSYGINQNMYDLINGNMTKVVSPSSIILIAPNYGVGSTGSTLWASLAAAAPYVRNLPVGGGAGMTTGLQRNGTQINALFCDLHVETMTFGPASTVGTFKDTTSNPLGLKHWDPTQ